MKTRRFGANRDNQPKTKVELEENPISCTISQQQLKTPKLLQYDLKKTKVPGRFKCFCCPGVFDTRHEKAVHLRRDHSDNGGITYQCYQCDKKFTTTTKLCVHFKIHEVKPRYSCDQCSKTFKHKVTLDTHVDICHRNATPFKCPYCRRQFGRQYAYTTHLRRHTEVGLKECPHCDKKFPTNNGFKSHIVTHTNQSEYMCCFCGVAVRSQYDLESHIRGHIKEKPYDCGECSMSFGSKVVLHRHHLQVHDGTRRYKCLFDSCKYATTLRSQLRKHIKIVHSETRPFSCELCPFSSKSRGNLKRHVGVHERNKCESCGKSYMRKRQLRLHECHPLQQKISKDRRHGDTAGRQ